MGVATPPGPPAAPPSALPDILIFLTSFESLAPLAPFVEVFATHLTHDCTRLFGECVWHPDVVAAHRTVFEIDGDVRLMLSKRSG